MPESTSNEIDYEQLSEIIAIKINSKQRISPSVEPLNKEHQQPMQHQQQITPFVTQTTIPSAYNAKGAWTQWFFGDASQGLFRPIKEISKTMLANERKKYSERVTLSLAFEKYPNFEMFEQEYAGHCNTNTALLKEVRKRKRENRL